MKPRKDLETEVLKHYKLDLKNVVAMNVKERPNGDIYSKKCLKNLAKQIKGTPIGFMDKDGVVEFATKKNGSLKVIKKKTGGRKPYKIGYAFECKVRKALRDKGWFVHRQHSSAFPDLICINNVIVRPDLKKSNINSKSIGKPSLVMFIEAKCNKYISKKERERFKEYAEYGECLIAYPRKNGRKSEVVLCDLDYNEVEVL